MGETGFGYFRHFAGSKNRYLTPILEKSVSDPDFVTPILLKSRGVYR